MSSRILAIVAVSLMLFSSSGSAPAVSKARQFLPALPGYIPVYIRSGDTPLEDINPNLAEAFRSYGQKHARLAFARSNEVKEIPLDNLDEDFAIEENAVSTTSKKPTPDDSQHIQKIPKH